MLVEAIHKFSAPEGNIEVGDVLHIQDAKRAKYLIELGFVKEKEKAVKAEKK